jgi:hypothetical protein
VAVVLKNASPLRRVKNGVAGWEGNDELLRVQDPLARAEPVTLARRASP